MDKSFTTVVVDSVSAEKYIALGWKVQSRQKVALRAIDKQYDEYTLVWEKETPPKHPEPTSPCQ